MVVNCFKLAKTPTEPPPLLTAKDLTPEDRCLNVRITTESSGIIGFIRYFLKMPQRHQDQKLAGNLLPVDDPGCANGGIDLLLLQDSLAKTPWERMLANDDALNFADMLHLAIERRNAQSKRTDQKID